MTEEQFNITPVLYSRMELPDEMRKEIREATIKEAIEKIMSEYHDNRKRATNDSDVYWCQGLLYAERLMKEMLNHD